MKKILTLAVLLITTCTAFAEKIQFNVKGIVDKNTSKVLFYINDMNRNNPQIIPVKNGKFSITGFEERNAILYFMIKSYLVQPKILNSTTCCKI